MTQEQFYQLLKESAQRQANLSERKKEIGKIYDVYKNKTDEKLTEKYYPNSFADKVDRVKAAASKVNREQPHYEMPGKKESEEMWRQEYGLTDWDKIY